MLFSVAHSTPTHVARALAVLTAYVLWQSVGLKVEAFVASFSCVKFVFAFLNVGGMCIVYGILCSIINCNGKSANYLS